MFPQYNLELLHSKLLSKIDHLVTKHPEAIFVLRRRTCQEPLVPIGGPVPYVLNLVPSHLSNRPSVMNQDPRVLPPVPQPVPRPNRFILDPALQELCNIPHERSLCSP